VSSGLTVNSCLDQRVLERLRAEYLEMPGTMDALLKVRFLRLNRIAKNAA
jgi:hypothetical protein